MLRALLVLTTITALLLACEDTTPDTPLLLDTPLAALPERLSDVGLYTDLTSRTASERVLAYTPRWPLWSNGSDKARFLFLPDDAQIDTAAPEAWGFPPGAILFKTFSYDGRAYETRLLRRTEEEGWEYAAYLWDDDGRDATLLEGRRGVEIPVETDGVSFSHRVPSTFECRQCHEGSPNVPLGFTELQLNHGAPQNELDRLWESGTLTARPEAPDAIPDTGDAVARDVLGYFQGNCVHCHNDSGRPSASFDLRHPVAFENVVDRPTESSASTAGIRVVPGDPDESVLFRAVASESDPSKAMPPVGVQRVDPDGIALLRTWILSLE